MSIWPNTEVDTGPSMQDMSQEMYRKRKSYSIQNSYSTFDAAALNNGMLPIDEEPTSKI